MRYLYSLVAVIAIVFLSFNAKAQVNMVPNGGFEQYATCPLSFARDASSWRPYTTGGSPDYFNACATSGVSVPANGFGYQYALNGVGYEGMAVYYRTSTLVPSYREYLTANITPLTPGVTYMVSMHVSLASGVIGSDNLGMYFFESAPSSITTSSFINATPQVSFASLGPIADTANWVELSALFTADSAYDNIVIGGFFPDNSVSLSGGGSVGISYYYIDSVMVTSRTTVNFAPTDSLYCTGDTIIVPFAAASMLLDSSNIFSLQLSDASGSFNGAVTIDTETHYNGILRWVVPSGITTGTNYKLRIKTSSPNDSFYIDKTITISSTIPNKPVAGSNSPICNGDSLKLTALSSTSGVSYKWLGPGFSSGSQNPFIINTTLARSGQYIVTAWLYGCKSKDTVNVTVKPLPQFTLAYNNFLCQSDTLKLNTTSGNTSVTYSWTGPNNFISTQKDTVRALMNFADTGYYVNTVTLNGCKYADSIKVNIKPLPQAFYASSNSPLCQGSVLNLSGNTSSTGVTYGWSGPNGYSSTSQSPSISNAQPVRSGSYILAAILNGCSIKDTEVVNVIAIPAVPAPTANTPVCVSQTLNLNAGGSGPGFLWSGPGSFVSSGMTPSIPNATSATSGVYTVKAIDGACESAPASVTVVVIPKPTVSTYPSPKDSICEGATVTFNASSSNAGTAATYKWFRNGLQEPGAFANKYSTAPLADYDVYYCMVTSNGTCATPLSDTSNHVVMRVFPWLAASVSITSTATGTERGGDLITFNATSVNGGNFPKYQWKRNNKDVVGALSGTWGAKTLDNKDVVCVEMSSSYLCPQPKAAMSNCITVSINTTGIDDTQLMKGVSIYPNPVHDELVIEGINTDARIQLFDVLGRVVMNVVATKEKEVLNTSLLTKGNYLLQLIDINGVRMNAKVVKE